MRFTKMEGLGNDYVYLDCTKECPGDLPALAARMSDRHFGVGSDGLICLLPSQRADFRMAIFNADGSQAEMCGNGIRCLAKFAYDKGLTEKRELRVETLAGVKTVSLSLENGAVTAATVDMGPPRLERHRYITCAGRELLVTPVSIGNPHAVFLADSVKQFPLRDVAPLSAPNPEFPQGVNLEAVELLARDRVAMRVWERGSGETLACGTGACAALAACVDRGLVDREATVCLPGGDLHVRWDETDGHVYMTGPARTVFEGEWPD